jgi:DDE superfamily endonuclease
VDHKKRFLDVEIGWPGSVNDKRLFRLSSLCRTYEAALEPLGTTPLNTGNDVVEQVPAFILGDSAYKNVRHFITTYINEECNHDPSIRHLNQRLSGARYIVENAFALLRARFQLFEKPLRCAAEDMPYTVHLIASIFVLHNFLIEVHDQQEEMLGDAIERQLELTRNEEEFEHRYSRNNGRNVRDDSGDDENEGINDNGAVLEETRNILLRHIRWLDVNN